MRIDLLCSDPAHPVVPRLRSWINDRNSDHDLRLVHNVSELEDGDILFLISCNQLISRKHRSKYAYVMVLHASDLPEGRGWSPHVWDILAGKEQLTLSLLSAEDGVDTGPIWAKLSFAVPRHALYNEINAILFQAELDLMDHGIEMVANNKGPVPQPTNNTSYHPRRIPEDSRLDPSLSLEELFDKIRVADPERFPAFFELHGKAYEISIKKREA